MNERGDNELGSDLGNEADSGRISVFIIVLMVIVISLVLVTSAVTVVHVQRRALYACADALTMAAVAEVHRGDYYGKHGARHATLRSAEIVAEEFVRHLDGSCDVGRDVRVDDVVNDLNTLTVSVSTTPRLPLLPAWLNLEAVSPVSQGWRIRVESTAEVD